MAVLTLLVEFAKAIAWPAVIFWVVFYFRKPVKGLIEGRKLKTFKGAGLEAGFVDDYEQDEEVVERVVSSALPPGATPPALPAVGAEIASESPRGAILAAWLTVEEAIDAAARDAGVSAKNFNEKLRALGDKGLLHASTVDAVTGLRMLRNLAAHGPEAIPAAKATDYMAMSSGVQFAITQNVKQARKKPPGTG